jgi:hypothetical protein
MKRIFIFCLFITPITIANSANISNKITWHAPTARTDGAHLLPSEIEKHTLKCGLNTGTYTLKLDVAMPLAETSIDFAIPGGDGYRYCVVTASDKKGGESLPSGEVKFYIAAGTAMQDKPEENGAPGSGIAKLVEIPGGE